VLVLLVLAAAGGLAAWLSGGRPKSAADSTGSTSALDAPVAASRPDPVRLVAGTTGMLASLIQDAAAARLDARHVLLLGGLTASDVSSDAIRIVGVRGERTVGRLPVAVHDTAAVRLGDAVYLFGGGSDTGQLDRILRVDPSGSVTGVGRLPAPSSDQAAAAIGGTAYVVGGYTGSRWLDTVVAWSPGGTAHVVGRLPTPLRYAAVAVAGGRVVVAGGSRPDGTASSAVLAFSPATGRVVRVGTLPAPTTHAAAVGIGNTVYVIGGRGAATGTPTARVVAIDLTTGSVRAAGRLPAPLSDLAAVSLPGGVLVAGGRDAGGTTDSLTELVPAGARANASASASTSEALTPAATVSAGNVYAADGANMLSPATRGALQRIYVPNSESGTVDVIDPKTYKVVEQFPVGLLPQHVTPAWDLKTLYVTNDIGNSLTPIDPKTGKPGSPIPVDDPYNMYFTPDGRYAIVVAERMHRLDFRFAHSFALHHSVAVPCAGVDHMDFSADGSYLIASCEFSGQLVKVDVAHERVVKTLTLPGGAADKPQDVKLSPDGKVFYVADLNANGVWKVDGTRLKVIGFVPTGRGAHGLYPSRDAKLLYVTNRGEGSISLISFKTRKVVRKWWIPGGGTPDMGGVSADGKVFWVSGRYSGVVYALSTANGKLLARIPVGSGPHGLCVWPQPGRYSLGHTGVLR
jgi:YVTN family beta-propeller protein